MERESVLLWRKDNSVPWWNGSETRITENESRLTGHQSRSRVLARAFWKVQTVSIVT